MGRRRGDRGDAALARARPLVDRGADEPRRHPRPRPHPPRDRSRARRHRRAHPEPVVFKQLFQAEAIDVCQLDACRVGGVNEAISIQLLAAKFGIPVCPHAGGVGLCEYVQHLAFFDYIAVSGSLENRVVEWVDHLHEHFRDPAVVRTAGTSLRLHPGTASRCCPSRSTSTHFPTGRRGSTSPSPWERIDGHHDRADADRGRREGIASIATGSFRSGSGRSGPGRR